MKQVSLLCLLIVALAITPAWASRLTTLPLHKVQLTGGDFHHAQTTNLDYLLALEPDKLLAPYLREAGLPIKTASYGNWENTGLDGHIGGHYLTALSLAYAATSDARMLERLHYMLQQLERAQRANGNGYLGGIPDGAAMWQQVAKGDIQADLFSMNKRWVPWYNLHKMFAGLRDAYQIAGLAKAKTLLINYGQWLKDLTQNLSEAQIQTMLITEYGGMNEVLVDMYAISGDKAYLRLAKSFSQRSILDPLLKQQDKLSGLHANTQIPKIIGFQRVAEMTGNTEWQQAAEFFWDRVVNHRSTAIGGNSVKEHFHGLDDFHAMVTDAEGPETCNTYNMLKLSKMLFLQTQEQRYLDYYERAMYNHILASQHPEHGGLVYFTSMRPGHYRVYSDVHQAMWCCVGSGIENHSKYAELVFALGSNNDVLVNLFVPAKAQFDTLGVSIEQITAFPQQDSSSLKINGSGQFTLKIRQPTWLKGNLLQVKVNGKSVQSIALTKGYVTIERHWHNGDVVDFALPMQTKAEPMPGNVDHYAIVHGPLVLAAKVNPFPNEQLNFVADDSRMGHIANGQMCPPEALPVILDDAQGFVEQLKPVAGQPLTFLAEQQLSNPLNDPLYLIPFYQLHDARYQVYWPNTSKQDLALFRDRAAREAAKQAQLDAITIDKVAPGEQQPESDHFYQGEHSEAGVHMGRHWRHAHKWFSYLLNDKQQQAKVLRISYFGLDNHRNFSIWLNDIKIASVALKGDKGNKFVDVDYPIPSALVANSQGQYRLMFKADAGSVAGGIYGVRLLRQ
ncbi:glycosyl hydrolase (plasmid) [Saccharobesus litoralis]|uniref:Glycosyl hydrolase n=1 Tax=Saccharobesus litoralis TaxID=2172099 RepID=A0A2S0VY70_9ALTE|nr:glycoside hydrolase family 127 protein [Saccharobesus litoralis]AWB69143.1 glycosyl hydrolase [Saccharobesus litoralis]